MKTQHVIMAIAACVALLTLPANAVTILGTGNGALLNNDLTDPDQNGNDTGSNYDAIFTANESPGWGGQLAFNLFDNNTGKMCCNNPAPSGWAIAAAFTDQYTLTHFTLMSNNDSPGRNPDVYQIQGSNDGSAWTNIYSYSNNDPAADGNRHDGDSDQFTANNQVIRVDGGGVDFATPVPYSHFRINMDSPAGWNGLAGELSLNEMELFGTRVPKLQLTNGSFESAAIQTLAGTQVNELGTANYVTGATVTAGGVTGWMGNSRIWYVNEGTGQFPDGDWGVRIDDRTDISADTLAQGGLQLFAGYTYTLEFDMWGETATTAGLTARITDAAAITDQTGGTDTLTILSDKTTVGNDGVVEHVSVDFVPTVTDTYALQFFVASDATNRNANNHVWIDNVTLVPEPTTLALTALGLLGLLGWGRRRRR